MKKTFANSLLAIALISGCSMTSTVFAANAKQLAPMASAAELKATFRELEPLTSAFLDTTPDNKNDLIKVGKLGADSGNKKQIVQLANEIADNKHGKFDSLLIFQKDQLLFESYYLRGRANLPHFQASATKGYLAMVVGRAIQLGYLTMADLDKPLISFLKELKPEKFSKGAQKITLHNALTMSSGVDISREQIKSFEENGKPLKGQKQVQTYLESMPDISEQPFKYKGVDPRLVMQVLEAKVPGSIRDFIKKELLDKLAISEYSWMDDVSGLPMGPYGSNMTSRNMLKWGMLAKNKGNWNGEQLIPKDYIKKALNRIVHLGEDDIFFTGKTVTKPGYGYYWWQADMQVGDKSYFTTSAQGGGGNYVVLIDELDLIVVTTAHDNEAKIMKIIAERILPAFI